MKAFTPIEAKAFRYVERRLLRKLTSEEREALRGEVTAGTGQEYRDAVDFMFDHGYSFTGEKGMTTFRGIYLAAVARKREKEWADEKAELTNTRIIDELTGTRTEPRRKNHNAEPLRLAFDLQEPPPHGAFDG